MRALPSFLLVVATLATAAPVGAFHGTPYSYPATACVDGTTVCFAALFAWSGGGGAGGGTYRLFLDGEGGNDQLLLSVYGREIYRSVWFASEPACTANERTLYSARDTQTNGEILALDGYQDNCLSGPGAGNRRMHLEGLYGPFYVVVHVAHF